MKEKYRFFAAAAAAALSMIVLIAFQNCTSNVAVLLSNSKPSVNASRNLSLVSANTPASSQFSYDIDPAGAFPTMSSLLPSGTTYSDQVPLTLDLSERAELFIKGAVQSVIPDLYYAPAGILLHDEDQANSCVAGVNPRPPCLFKSPQNWGKVMQGLSFARKMTAFDRGDLSKTLSSQHRMMLNMLDRNVSLALQSQGFASIVFSGQHCSTGCVTTSTVAMQAVLTEWVRKPSPALMNALNGFLQIHSEALENFTDSEGKTYSAFFSGTNTAQEMEQPLGYLGQYWRPFINGKALRVFSDMYLQTGDPRALSIANALSEYLRNYEHNLVWKSPDPTRFPNGSGYFAGHIHSWLQAALGLATHAEALRKTDRDSLLAQAELNLARDVYSFVKMRTRAGMIGNFGESGATGDMILLAIKLTNQGVGYYYEDAESWTRNALAEMQIDAGAAQYIANNQDSIYVRDKIGTKVQGMFFGDGTHALAIPFHHAGGTSDYAPNSFAGMHEVWKNTVVYKNNFAQINFLLNHASQYLDVYSDLPYGGRVVIKTKPSLGPITSFGVRIPDWADRNQVKVAALDTQGREYLLPQNDWAWIAGAPFVQVLRAFPNISYIVKFPIKVYTKEIYELRSMDQQWYEASYPPSSGYPETVISYQGKFRGNTLVDVDHRPAWGIPRYQRQNLAALPDSDVPAPKVTLQRFVAD